MGELNNHSELFDAWPLKKVQLKPLNTHSVQLFFKDHCASYNLVCFNIIVLRSVFLGTGTIFASCDLFANQ